MEGIARSTHQSSVKSGEKKKKGYKTPGVDLHRNVAHNSYSLFYVSVLWGGVGGGGGLI